MRFHLLAMLFASALAMQQPAAGVQLLASIRTGDATSTEQLLRSGVDVNARDESTQVSPMVPINSFRQPQPPGR